MKKINDIQTIVNIEILIKENKMKKIKCTRKTSDIFLLK